MNGSRQVLLNNIYVSVRFSSPSCLVCFLFTSDTPCFSRHSFKLSSVLFPNALLRTIPFIVLYVMHANTTTFTSARACTCLILSDCSALFDSISSASFPAFVIFVGWLAYCLSLWSVLIISNSDSISTLGNLIVK